jgi:molybdate transport system substrate-binding protein
MTAELRVMTSGAFTGAHLALLPQVEALTGQKVLTLTTSIGTGDTSIPNRLKRGEVADVVMVVSGVMQQFVADGLVQGESVTPLARSTIGIAVRAGMPKPHIDTVEAFKRYMLEAKSLAYSASVSGTYLMTDLFPRLGILDAMKAKSVWVGNGQRTAAVVARGEAEVCCQQISEMLPVAGIEHITPLPAEIQKVSLYMAAVGANSTNGAAARQMIGLLSSPAAAAAIRASGLEPA